ncbi:MAG: endonuclease III domain-containing protein [bacterium]
MPSEYEKTLIKIDELLRERFSLPNREKEDAIDVLIRTILSQNTSDKNSHRAFANLKRLFPDWTALLVAPLERIETAIKCGGISKIKARRIKEILQRIKKETGSLSLSFLADLSLQDARKYLLSLPGVGDKTASCVLLFSFSMPAFPVDTHIHRIINRLGIFSNNLSPAKISQLIEAHLPKERFLSLHLNLIRLGREICRPRNPSCHICPLKELCNHYAVRLPSEN